jgi:hypothetical protein
LLLEGWVVIRPEDFDVLTQAELFNSAKLVAGFDSSAFHTILLSGDIDASVVIFKRTKERKVDNNQHLVFSAMKYVNCRIVDDIDFKSDVVNESSVLKHLGVEKLSATNERIFNLLQEQSQGIHDVNSHAARVIKELLYLISNNGRYNVSLFKDALYALGWHSQFKAIVKQIYNVIINKDKDKG